MIFVVVCLGMTILIFSVLAMSLRWLRSKLVCGIEPRSRHIQATRWGLIASGVVLSFLSIGVCGASLAAYYNLGVYGRLLVLICITICMVVYVLAFLTASAAFFRTR